MSTITLNAAFAAPRTSAAFAGAASRARATLAAVADAIDTYGLVEGAALLAAAGFASLFIAGAFGLPL